jgi:hypothetical protein
VGEGLTGIHNLLGGLVVVAFIVVVVLAAIQAAGRSGDAIRVVSFAAAALLLLQYVVGFALLGSNARNSEAHYIIALLLIVPVAVQHGAARRFSSPSRGMVTLIAALAAAFLSVIAYLTGMQGA